MNLLHAKCNDCIAQFNMYDEKIMQDCVSSHEQRTGHKMTIEVLS